MTEQNNHPPAFATAEAPGKLIRPDRCECCKFAEKKTAPDPRYECHRLPPTASSFMAPGPQGKPTIVSNAAYPITLGTQWCGEYRSKVVH